MNFSIDIPGEEGKPKRFRRLLTLDQMKKLIHNMELDEYTTNGLIEMASKYPTHALPSFRKNINIMINRVRAKRQKEQQREDLENESQRTSEDSSSS